LTIVAEKSRQLVNDVQDDDAAVIGETRQLVQRREEPRKVDQRVAVIAA
jgi:hypothetical protein